MFALASGACARPEVVQSAANPPSALPSAAEPLSGSVEPAAVQPDPEPRGLDPSLADRVPLWLPRLYGALHELAAGGRDRHVRILWFGDSHTAADFWSGAVRHALQQRFGAGGAGLVLLGRRMYRHALAQLSTSGGWRPIPRTAAATWLQADGVLGLAGLGAVPTSDDAGVALALNAGTASAGPLRWQLLYRLPRPGSAFQVQLGDEPPREIRAGVGERRPSGLESASLSSAGAAELRLGGFVDEPELFGVIIERESSGVVLDTLGINGARAATPLAWNADAWVAELEARQPDLVVLAYGTNEVGDTAPMSEYQAHYAGLLERVRSAAPDADCLLLGPTDRVAKDWTSMPRVALLDRTGRQIAAELGCAFFSPLQAMGGPGSLRRWAFSNPQLARRDRVHLLASGYRRLGISLVEQIVASFQTCYPDAVLAP